MTDRKLADKVIVISGGTKGVGREAAIEFARVGAKVAFGGRDVTAGTQIIEAIRQVGSDGLFIQTDLQNVGDCKKLFDQTLNRFGKVDGFFNYAGVTSISPLDTCTEETFDVVMDVNFKACFFCCQEAIRCMRANGGGAIVLTGSAHAWGGLKDRAAYACSKGALLTLMEHIAHQYATEKIRCNYLALGWTATEGELALRKSMGESEQEFRQRANALCPMGRICESNDYLEMLTYLFSDASYMMTGSVLRMTGGIYI